MVVVDADPIWLLVDSMPPYGHSGHWHAGKPTLHVWVHGRMLLGDAGCPNYDDALYGAWFRRGPAHSAVTVDGCEDAEFVSDVRWDKPPRLEMTRCERTPDGAEISFESTGFHRLNDPVAYTRHVACSRDELVIRDCLRSQHGAPHIFRLHMPFLAEDVRADGPNRCVARLAGRSVSVEWHATAREPSAGFSEKPVSVGTRRGERPYLQVEVGGVQETEFLVRIRPDA